MHIKRDSKEDMVRSRWPWGSGSTCKSCWSCIHSHTHHLSEPCSLYHALLLLDSGPYPTTNISPKISCIIFASQKHQANSLSGWDSSPPCKWCRFYYPPRHISVTHYGPPNHCGGHQVNSSFKKLWVSRGLVNLVGNGSSRCPLYSC